MPSPGHRRHRAVPAPEPRRQHGPMGLEKSAVMDTFGCSPTNLPGTPARERAQNVPARPLGGLPSTLGRARRLPATATEGVDARAQEDEQAPRPNVTSARVRARPRRTCCPGLRRRQHEDRRSPRLVAGTGARAGTGRSQQSPADRSRRHDRHSPRSSRTRGDRRRPRCAATPPRTGGGLLPRRPGPPGRRGDAPTVHRRAALDGSERPAQRHLRCPPCRHHRSVGHRRGLRDGAELRRCRARRVAGPLPRPRGAVG
jgi:hypothetical protein